MAVKEERRARVQKIMGGGDNKPSPKITAENLLPTKPGGGARITSEQVQSLHIVNVKLGEVSNGLKDQLVLSKVREGIRKRRAEKERRKAREAALEAKKGKKKDDKGGGLKAKGMGFLERVFNFLLTFLIGSVIMKLVGVLNTKWFQSFLKGFIGLISWVGNIGGKILDGLVTFIDWAYGLYDQLEQWIGNTFGEEAVEKFKTFSNNLKNLISGFLVWKLVFEKIFKQIIANIRGAFRFVKNLIRTIWTKVRRLIGRKARMFFAKLAQRAGNFVRGIGSRIGQAGSRVVQAGRGLVSRGLSRAGGVLGRVTGGAAGKVGGLVGKIFGKAANIIGPAIKGAMPAVKGFFGRIPILGPLIVGIVSLMSGEPPGQALFKAIGAALGGALGTFIPIPILGTLLGETIGVFVGDLMYHLVIRRDPQAAFKMLKDTIMGIFGFLTKIPILGDIIRLWQQGGNILLNFGKWVFMDAIPWAAAKIGSIGQIISEWMTSGVQRFMDTFPSFEIPNWGIQDLVSDILSMKWPRWITDINIMGWRPFGGYEDQPVFPWFQGEFPEWFENLPRMPRVLGWLWQNVPLLNNLVDSNGEVHKIPKLWLLANPIFMHGHLKSSFFPGMGAGSADSGGSVSGGSNGSSEDAAAVSESASYEEGGEGEAMIIPVPIVTPANTTVTSGGGGGGGTSSRERADDPMLVLYSG